MSPLVSVSIFTFYISLVGCLFVNHLYKSKPLRIFDCGGAVILAFIIGQLLLLNTSGIKIFFLSLPFALYAYIKNSNIDTLKRVVIFTICALPAFFVFKLNPVFLVAIPSFFAFDTLDVKKQMTVNVILISFFVAVISQKPLFKIFLVLCDGYMAVLIGSLFVKLKTQKQVMEYFAYSVSVFTILILAGGYHA